MLSHALCAFVAPAFVAAVAHNPWLLAQPTFAIPEIDNWSPAPTEPPNAFHINLFRRADSTANGTVCGYTSGISTLSLTCNPGKSSVCATNTYYGVHGCCDPSNMSACTIPTTCIASSQIRTLCTDSACSSNSLTLKCTGSEAPECARWDFVYPTGRTTFSEWGCAAKPGTVTVERTPRASGPITTSPTRSSSVTWTTSTAQPSPTSLPLTQQPSKPNNTGAIVGGAVGGLVVVGAVATLIIWLLLRHRRLKRESFPNPTNNSEQQNNPAVTEYNPHGFAPANTWHDDQKGWIGPHVTPTSTTMSPGADVYQGAWNDHGTRPGELGAGAQTDWLVVEAGGRPVHEVP